MRGRHTSLPRPTRQCTRNGRARPQAQRTFQYVSDTRRSCSILPSTPGWARTSLARPAIGRRRPRRAEVAPGDRRSDGGRPRAPRGAASRPSASGRARCCIAASGAAAVGWSRECEPRKDGRGATGHWLAEPRGHSCCDARCRWRRGCGMRLLVRAGRTPSVGGLRRMWWWARTGGQRQCYFSPPPHPMLCHAPPGHTRPARPACARWAI
jgi:hypothetical protein